jgi:hypothetical protein
MFHPIQRQVGMKLFHYSAILVLLIFLGNPKSISAQKLPGEVKFSEHKFIPGYGFKKAGNPEMFQGNKKKKRYFEGWYFKMVSADGQSILSIIPGISLSPDGSEQHAFIQVINGKTAQTYYYTFPIEAFAFSQEKFAVTIGDNYFSANRLLLNLRDDSTSLSGEVLMSEQKELPSARILNPGIMGWYRFVPFMQCYHGVVSLNHRLEGTLIKNGQTHDFSEGKGYIEKDWGSSMPSAWIWMQSNNFSNNEASFMLSVANIPWLGKSFTGFLGFFYYNGEIHRFATYTGAKLNLDHKGLDTLHIQIYDKKRVYQIEAIHKSAGLLMAPVGGSMDRRISESIDATLKLTVMDRQGNVLFKDSSFISGLELVGDQGILSGSKKKREGNQGRESGTRDGK